MSELQAITLSCECNSEYDSFSYRKLELVKIDTFASDSARLELRKCGCGEVLHTWIDKDGRFRRKDYGLEQLSDAS